MVATTRSRAVVTPPAQRNTLTYPVQGGAVRRLYDDLLVVAVDQEVVITSGEGVGQIGTIERLHQNGGAYIRFHSHRPTQFKQRRVFQPIRRKELARGRAFKVGMMAYKRTDPHVVGVVSFVHRATRRIKARVSWNNYVTHRTTRVTHNTVVPFVYVNMDTNQEINIVG